MRGEDRLIRVDHFSTLERTGGATRAAFRLHQALLAAGAASRFVAHRQESDEASVLGLDRRFGPLSFYLPAAVDDRLTRLLAPADGLLRTGAFVGRSLAKALAEAPCELCHLHWVGGGFLRPEALPSAQRPIVWTLHDQWAFCGAEHYPRSERYQTGYRRADAPPGLFDLDRWLFRRKQRAYARTPSLHFIAPSRWIRDRAARSALLRDRPIEVLPNGIDTAHYQPLDRAFSRKALGLPPDRPLVLFMALSATSDPRKGWPLLREALGRLAVAVPGVELVIAGGSSGPELPVPAHYLGRLHDDAALAAACSAADVFVCPSTDDNLPNTVVESLACGTPVVAFAVGGLPDLLTHQRDGFLARPGDAADLAAGIAWVLGGEERRAALGREARAGALARYSYAVVAARHLELYGRILEGSRRR